MTTKEKIANYYSTKTVYGHTECCLWYSVNFFTVPEYTLKIIKPVYLIPYSMGYIRLKENTIQAKDYQLLITLSVLGFIREKLKE